MGGSFFEAALARRANEIFEQGVEQGLLFSAQRLIKKEGWPFDKAMTLLDVPHEQWKNYAEQMEQRMS